MLTYGSLPQPWPTLSFNQMGSSTQPTSGLDKFGYGPNLGTKQIQRLANAEATLAGIRPQEKEVEKSPLEKMQEQVQMAMLQKQMQQMQPRSTFNNTTPSLKAQPAVSAQPMGYAKPPPGLGIAPGGVRPMGGGRSSGGSGKNSSSGSDSPREWVTTGTGGLPGLQNTGGAATGGPLGGSGPLNLVKGVTGYNDRMGPATPGTSSYDYTRNPANTAKPIGSRAPTGLANETVYNPQKPSNQSILSGLADDDEKRRSRQRG